MRVCGRVEGAEDGGYGARVWPGTAGEALITAPSLADSGIERC